MTKKSRSENLVDKMKAAGYELNREQGAARFKFVISPVTAGAVRDLKLTLQFQRKVFERIKGKSFNSPLTGVVLFPKIMDPAIATWPDSITHKRKEKAYFVSINIPFRRWDSASFNERIDLLADNLIASIAKIPPRNLTEEDHLIVSEAIREVQANMKLKLVGSPD